MLELRKLADRSGKPIDTVYRDVNGKDVDPVKARKLNKAAEAEGLDAPYREVDVWPAAGVELVGEAPKEHGFSDTLVAGAIEAGYLEIENVKPVSTSAKGQRYLRDPVLSGDAIVLKLDNGKFRYEIVEHPGVYEDADEPTGVRVSNEYRCKLAAGKKKG